MSTYEPKPGLKISGASPDQLQQMQTWLGEHYHIEEDTPDIELKFPEPGSAGAAITISANYGNTLHAQERAQNSKQYTIPMESFNESTIKVILTLITRKKEEIRKNRDYQYAFLHAQDMILIADCDHMILNANPSAILKLGYSRKELLQMNIRQLFCSQTESEQFIESICVDNEDVKQEYKFCSQSGQPLPTMVRATVMNEEEGIFLIIAQDISKQKELESAKKKQDQLATTGKMAGIIAHEVRNPLYNIVLAAQFLSDTDHRQNNEDRELIQRNCKRIDNLIRQLLEPAQWGTLTLGAVSVAELIENALLQVADRMQLQGDVRIIREIDQDIRLFLDQEKITTALTNIIINASEAIAHPEGTITIKAGIEQETLVISVSDNGKGLTEAEQQELFSPYYTTKEHGLGLGLVNTLQIIKAHKGLIKFSSKEGAGTTFSLILPFAPVTPDHPEDN